MVTSDMQRAADLPSRCVQFTTFYMKRFTTVLRKMQTSIFFFVISYSDGYHKKTRQENGNVQYCFELLEGSVKPLSEKLTAKSRRAKIKLTL